jgi:(E)-4-hydroxy-3-methylbut-2-enyl-diphosphate synthase
LHLGVTEAGNESYARVKSSIGIGSLLLQGIGDTIRVSLTENPVNEIPVAYEILQASGVRSNFVEYIACPSCGRTQFDIQKVLNEIKEKTKSYKNITIAVMGCVVNGIGEMGNADFGYVGSGKGKVNLYHRGQLIKSNIPQENAVNELIELIEVVKKLSI